MTKRRPKRSVWDRGEREPLPQTERAKTMANLGSRKILTVNEAATYLRCSKDLVNRLIAKGVLEVMNDGSRRRHISGETLKGLIMPVRSLNKRLQYLEEIKSEIEKEIKKKEERLITLSNENNRN